MSLQDLMKEQGLTIEQLHDKSKVSVSTIKRALNGDNMSATSIKRLSAGLDLSEDEFKILLKELSKPDYITGLVNPQLNKLDALGLVFEPSDQQPDSPVYQSIEQDLCGDLSYFPDEFEKQVNKAESKNQLTALKELVPYCAAYLLDQGFDIDLKATSFVSLRGGNNAWELRLHINAALEKLEGLEFRLIQCADNGVTTLAPVERAHQLGLSTSANAMELLLDIAKQINAQEAFTHKPCPDQLRQGNSNDLEMFKTYCEDLNDHLDYDKNSLRNVFAFDHMPISNEVIDLLTEYLPALRVMIIQVDNGTPFLISNHKIHVVLIRMLTLVADREKELFGSVVNDKENDVSANTAINVEGNVETIISGQNHQIQIGIQLNELIPLLKEIQGMLSPTYSADSQEMHALDDAINANPQAPQDAINKIDKALKTTENLVNRGTRLASLYDKAVALFSGLTIIC